MSRVSAKFTLRYPDEELRLIEDVKSRGWESVTGELASCSQA
jgi:hypothetical protein